MRVPKIFLPILMILMLSLLFVSCENGTSETSDTASETPSEAAITEELTFPDETETEEIGGTEEATTEEITTSEATAEEVTTVEVTTEEVTTEEVTTEEVITEEVITEEVTTEEVTSEEITTAEETTSQPEPHVHIWGSWTLSKPADCVDGGEEKRSCSCGESETRYTESLGHIEGRFVTVQTPTCTSEGYGYRICGRCTLILNTEKLTKTEHTSKITVKKATCTEDGFEKTSCKVCETQLNYKVLKAFGHTEGGRVLESKLSCTEDGVTHIICSSCSAVLRTETEKAKGHAEGRNVPFKMPTCTEDGAQYVICSVCTLILRTETLKASGHTAGTWTTSEELSTEEISVRQKKCISCGFVVESKTEKSLALIEAERVSAAINAVSGKNSFTFAVMADIHVDNVGVGYNQIPTKNSLNFAVRTLTLIEKMSEVKMLALLGDYTASSRGYSVANIKSDFKYVRELFDGVGDYPVAWVRGNHEINYYADSERPLTNDEIFENIESNSRGLTTDPLNPKGGYGYIDFPENKIRMIFLNTSDVYGEYEFIDGQNAPSVGIGSVQLRWFASVALDFSDKKDASEWGIIINSHVPLDYMNDTGYVLKILEAYRKGWSGGLEYVRNGKKYSIDYYFAVDERAEVICSIHGHIHNFKYDKISSSASVEPWLWRVCVPNVGALRENQYADGAGNMGEKWGDYDENGAPIYYTKCNWDAQLGTYVYDEDAGTSYCMVTVDRNSRRLYVHCVGTGIDRIIDY